MIHVTYILHSRENHNNISIFQAAFNRVHLNVRSDILQINGASQIEVTYFEFQQREKIRLPLDQKTNHRYLTHDVCVNFFFLRSIFSITYMKCHAKIVHFE